MTPTDKPTQKRVRSFESNTDSSPLRKKRRPIADRLSPPVTRPGAVVGRQRPQRAAQPALSSQAVPPNEEDDDAILSTLTPRYRLLTPSVISSAKIRTRVAAAIAHLGPNPSALPALVLFQARPAEVGKMITIVEQTKRALTPADAPTALWYQYNQLFSPAVDVLKETILEETILQETILQEQVDPDPCEDGDFESMHDYRTPAISTAAAINLPQPPSAPCQRNRSIRIFLARLPVPQLQSLEGVTEQTNAPTR